MSFYQAKPSGKLAPFVKQYWMIENCLSPGSSHIQRIIPSGLMELTFYSGRRPSILKDKKNLSDNAVVSGQMLDFHDMKISGNFSVFSVTLKPQGAFVFLGLPMIELLDQHVALHLLNKKYGRELENRVSDTEGFYEKISQVEHYFLQQLKSTNLQAYSNRINASITTINQNKGVTSIEALASEACLGKKQYEKLFKDKIGIAPKRFLRTVRFQNAIDNKCSNPAMSLTNLAYTCGYYDQSHMINDFKKLSGLSPREFFSACEESGSDYFSV